MITLASRLRLHALILASTEMDLEKQPKFYRLLASYLKSEPESNFHTDTIEEHGPDKTLPLMLNESAEKTLEGLLSESFSARMPSGKAGVPYVNFLYILGQALVAMMSKLQFDTIMDKNEKTKKEKEKAEKALYVLWSDGSGDYRAMSAGGLYRSYQGKSTKETIHSLVKKLENSAKIIEFLTKPENAHSTAQAG